MYSLQSMQYKMYSVQFSTVYSEQNTRQDVQPLTCVHVRTCLVELSPEQLHTHDSTEDDEEEDKDRHVHQRN